MLASDVNNPEFMNPQNPDEALFVQFYMHDPVLHRATLNTKEQRLGKKVPYVRIARPGDQTTVIEAAVRDSHKIRFPKQWMAFQVREGLLQAPPALGWKLEDWDEVKDNENLLNQLRYNRFETVEQVAGAADAQIQGLGIGAIGLREKARFAVRERNKAEFAGEMAEKDKLIADLSARLSKLEAAAGPVQPPAPPPEQPQAKEKQRTLEPLPMPKKG